MNFIKFLNEAGDFNIINSEGIDDKNKLLEDIDFEEIKKVLAVLNSTRLYFDKNMTNIYNELKTHDQYIQEVNMFTKQISLEFNKLYKEYSVFNYDQNIYALDVGNNAVITLYTPYIKHNNNIYSFTFTFLSIYDKDKK
jgi:hypothetical protein